MDGRCPHCGNSRDSIGHWLEHCVSLEPLRAWLRTVWEQLAWPGPPPQFGSFLVYGYAQRSPGTRQLQVIQGALLTAAKWIRHQRIATDRARSVGEHEAVAVLRQRLQRHLTVDAHCARHKLSVLGRPSSKKAWVDVWEPIIDGRAWRSGQVKLVNAGD